MQKNAVKRCIRGNMEARRCGASTLIELLVVVAIIALLISILLPSLSAVGAGQGHQVCRELVERPGKAVANYLAENRGNFPLLNHYASDANGGYDINRQSLNPPMGLSSIGRINSSRTARRRTRRSSALRWTMADICRHRSRPDSSNWSANRWTSAATAPTGTGQFRVEDRQAKRMAYTLNPRRRSCPSDTAGKLVRDRTRRIGMFATRKSRTAAGPFSPTEFVNNWKAISVDMVGQFRASRIARSCRSSIEGMGYDEFSIPLGGMTDYLFTYWSTVPDHDYGLLPYNRLDEADALVEAAHAR